MNRLEMTGQARSHVVQLESSSVMLHHDVVEPFLALRAAAALHGFDLVPSSAFRDFQHQAEIWNQKFRGQRPLYDRAGHLCDPSTLTQEQTLDAVLAWTALPGASRHHWGSDLDVYDRAVLSDGERVELLPARYGPGGKFEELAVWLDASLHRFGFFRPYDKDRGGISPEPWHISCAAVSEPARAELGVELVAAALQETALCGGPLVLARLPEIFERYVVNVASSLRWL